MCNTAPTSLLFFVFPSISFNRRGGNQCATLFPLSPTLFPSLLLNFSSLALPLPSISFNSGQTGEEETGVQHCFPSISFKIVHSRPTEGNWCPTLLLSTSLPLYLFSDSSLFPLSLRCFVFPALTFPFFLPSFFPSSTWSTPSFVISLPPSECKSLQPRIDGFLENWRHFVAL